MSAAAPPQAPRRDAAAASGLVAAGLAALGSATLADAHFLFALGAGLLLGAIAVRRPVIPWSNALVALLLVILFIPIRRYRFPGDLPFQLEPYRLLVGLLLVGWVAALLVDPRVTLRRSRFDVPIALVVLATVASIAANPARVAELQPTVLKSLTFFLSFVAVVYLVSSVVRTGTVVDTLVKTLVGGGAVVGILAVLEARSGLAPFAHLHSVFPFLMLDPSFTGGIGRGGAVRAFGPAEHPIALGAALAMLVPLAIYLARASSPRWWLALGALGLGVVASGSRTAILMLAVVALVFLWLRPTETKRLWPLLIPLVVVTHFAVPGTLGSLKQAFLPEGGLIQEQRGSEGSCSSAGRIADLAPTLAEVSKKPFLGYGFGTRIVTGEGSNACILDNQWLGTLLEVGALGTVAWLLLFLAVIRRCGRAAKRDASSRGWLLVAISAAVAAYAVGMLTFDAFGFVQVTFLLFVVFGLGAIALRDVVGRPASPGRVSIGSIRSA